MKCLNIGTVVIMFKSFVLGISLAVISFCNIANATSCYSGNPQEHVDDTDVIFYGKVIDGGGPPNNQMQIVKFDVLTAYKGTTENTVIVQYFNDHGALQGWGFQSGQDVMIFADIDRSAKDDGTKLSLHYCSMVPYHLRTELHADYWDILVGKSVSIDAPKFEDYSVNIYKGPLRSLNLQSHPEARSYRTRLRNAVKGEVNFAGKYILTTWGCGTSCITGAVIDARSGAVQFLPGTICCWFEAGEDTYPIDYKLDSNLIIFTGLIDEKQPIAKHYYELRDGQFELLKMDTNFSISLAQ